MIRDEEKYKQAVEFRKRGFTYSEIAKIVGISKSTASAWLSKKAFSKRVAKDNAKRAARENIKRMELLNKARKNERRARYHEALHTAETEFKHYKHSPLFIAGLSLYMADGDQKDPSRIRVSSTNPNLHRIFIHFLHDFMGMEPDEVTFITTLYSGMDEAKEMKWWSRNIKIKLGVYHFGKTQFLKTNNTAQSSPSTTTKTKNHPTPPQNHGSGTTFTDNTFQKKKLLHWLHLLQHEL